MKSYSSIIIGGPEVTDIALIKLRHESIAKRYSKNGIVIYSILTLFHQLSGKQLPLIDDQKNPGQISMFSYPVIVKPSWHSVLLLNYSRPPNLVFVTHGAVREKSIKQ